MTDPERALLAAIRAIGGKHVLAYRLGVTKQAVQAWKRCPVLRVLDVERLTGVSRHALRPDVYPAER